MNKKILALAMVPLLIGLSGAMAFSQFTGTDVKTINASAGTFSMTESAAVVGYYASSGSQLTVVGSVESGQSAVTWTPSSTSNELGTVSLSAGESSMTYTITISNLAPAEWVNITFTIVNTGSLSVTLSPGTPSTGVSPTSVGPATVVPASDFMTTGTPLSSSVSGWVYSTYGETALSGLTLTPTGASNTAMFSVGIGLGTANNNFEGSSFTFSINISLSAE